MNDYLERLSVKKPAKAFTQVNVEEFVDFHPNKKKFNPSALKRLENVVVSSEEEGDTEDVSFEVTDAKRKKPQKVVLADEDEDDVDEEEQQDEQQEGEKEEDHIPKTDHAQKFLEALESKSASSLNPSSPKRLKVDSYILNNRERFVTFINSVFRPYKKEFEESSEPITCETIKNNDFTNTSLMIHQQLVQDYLNVYTPYRGLLLWQDITSCISIAMAEGIKDSRRVMVMTHEAKDIEQLKTCGDSLFKKNQYWEWVSLHDHPDALKQLSTVLNLSEEFITKQGGAFLVHSKRKSNYESLSEANQKKLEEQLNKMIMHKYEFIDYTKMTDTKVEDKTHNYSVNMFDNAVVIIEQAHHFVGRIAGKLNELQENEQHFVSDLSAGAANKDLFLKLYEMLLRANNVRIILLTNHPMVNQPNEVGVLFNILRGYIVTWKLVLDGSDCKENVNLNWLQKHLVGVDYIDYSSSHHELTITRNPFGFRSSGHQGVERTTDEDYSTDDDFLMDVTNILKKHHVRVLSTTIKHYKALPDRAEEFNEMFIDTETMTMKNVDTFQRRILGLSSCFQTAQESLLPTFEKEMEKDYHIIHIPMSNKQFEIYQAIRDEERKRDREPDMSSSYRLASRLVCNYAMDNNDISDEKKLVHMMETKSEQYFSKKALQTYSPKLLAILKNIQNKKYLGLHVVYSHLPTSLFGLVLKENGFAQFKVKKNHNGVWEIDIPHEERGQPMFAMYDDDHRDESELVRKIYNGEWNEKGFPKNIRQELERMHPNNNMGEVIKVIVVTGRSTEMHVQNTRYVHLMDPYWQPVPQQLLMDGVRRLCSHQDLPQKMRTVEVFVYLMTFPTDNVIPDDTSKWTGRPITTDEYLFELSEEKARLTQQITDAIKQAAIDCFIFSDSPSKCVQFGRPSMKKFAYTPSYEGNENEGKGILTESNTHRVKDENGVEYVAVHIENSVYHVHDIDSVAKFLEKSLHQRDANELKPMGKMFRFLDEDGRSAHRMVLD